jgi:hypothetical protein
MLMASNTLTISGDTPLQPLVLLVETDFELLASRTLLLTQFDYGVVTAKTPREIVELQCLGGVQIAILSDALELAQLRASAESVRLQWPSARILILGHVPFALDDHLYDESIDPRFDPKKLLDTLKKLNQEAWTRQSLSPEWHLTGYAFSDLAQSNRPWRPQESDPKKEIQTAAPSSYPAMRALSSPHGRR